jgi:hypothetical protein
MKPAADPLDRAGSRAILIGTANYADTRVLPRPSARTSLHAMHRMLVDARFGGWRYDQVTAIEDPTDCRRLAQDIRRIAKGTTGALLVYFVGHGILAPTGELILLLTDTDSDYADVTGLEFTRIRDALLDSPAQVKIIILDCCYAGRAINTLASTADGLVDNTEVRGAYTLTAADRAAHAGQPDGCTSFTGQFLDLISTGVPGAPQVLTFADLYPHLRHRLAASGLPLPNQRGTDTAGHYPVARNRAAHSNAGVTPPPPPPDQPAADPAQAVRIERREPWVNMIKASVLVAIMFVVIILAEGHGTELLTEWSTPGPWVACGSILLGILIGNIIGWRRYQTGGPLVIDSSGIRYDAGMFDREIPWTWVQRVHLIGNGAGSRLVVWYHPGVRPPNPVRRGPNNSYLLLRPARFYGHGPYQAVNEHIRQALSAFAGDKYGK